MRSAGVRKLAVLTLLGGAAAAIALWVAAGATPTAAPPAAQESHIASRTSAEGADAVVAPTIVPLATPREVLEARLQAAAPRFALERLTLDVLTQEHLDPSVWDSIRSRLREHPLSSAECLARAHAASSAAEAAFFLLAAGRVADCGPGQERALVEHALDSSADGRTRLAAIQGLRHGCAYGSLGALALESLVALEHRASSTGDSAHAVEYHVLRLAFLEGDVTPDDARRARAALEGRNAPEELHEAVWRALGRTGGLGALGEIELSLRLGQTAARAGLAEVTHPGATDALLQLGLERARSGGGEDARKDAAAVMRALLETGTETSFASFARLADEVHSAWDAEVGKDLLLRAAGGVRSPLTRVRLLDPAHVAMVTNRLNWPDPFDGEAARSFARIWRDRRMPEALHASMRAEVRRILASVPADAPTAGELLFLNTEWGLAEDAAFARSQAHRLGRSDAAGWAEWLESKGKGQRPW